MLHRRVLFAKYFESSRPISFMPQNLDSEDGFELATVPSNEVVCVCRRLGRRASITDKSHPGNRSKWDEQKIFLRKVNAKILLLLCRSIVFYRLLVSNALFTNNG